MKTKVQLNDMELNQVAGGGLKELIQKIHEIIHPHIPIPRPMDPKPERFPDMFN